MYFLPLTVALFAGLMLCGMTFAIVAKKLTVPAAVTGAGVCTIIFTGVGWPGVALMTAFFVVGTFVTSWKKQQKAALGLAQQNSGRRTSSQVLANAGTAGVLALLAHVFPAEAPLCLYLVAAVFSSATADTVSSEIGSVYGKRFYDVLSWKQVPPGGDGVISLEGSFAGLLSSSLMAAIYSLTAGWHEATAGVIIAGTAGNLADSLLGATLERKGLVGNDAVNLLNTIAAVIIALLLILL